MAAIIKATSLPLGPVFPTPTGAIDYARRWLNRTRHGYDLTQHVGHRITAVESCTDGFQLHLDNDCTFQFCLSEEVVDIILLSAGSHDLEAVADTDDVVYIELSGKIFDWHKTKSLRSLKGKEFLYIQFSGRACFLSVKEVPILLISVLMNRNEMKPFLFWSIADSRDNSELLIRVLNS